MTRPTTSLVSAVAANRWGRGRPVRHLAVVAAVVGLVVVAQPAVSASAAEYQRTVRVNLSSTGAQSNSQEFADPDFGLVGVPAISANGRHVAFITSASDLVPGDTNDMSDVFVRDVATGKTRRASLSSTGAEADQGSSGLAISADGRHVAFTSYASNLVPADTNSHGDVFVRDMATGKTRRASLSSTGTEANNSADISVSLSADGRHVAFTSYASNLVPADTNDKADAFVRDMATGKTRRASLSSTGSQANNNIDTGLALSADGRHVAFVAHATNLVPADTNDVMDVFVRDMATGKTRRANVSSTGAQANGYGGWYPAISADGRYVAFTSNATNLAPGDYQQDIFVRDMRTGQTRRVSLSNTGAQSDSYSWGPAISADGRYIAYSGDGANLVPGDTNDTADVFVRDMATGKTRRVSLSNTGAQGNSYSWGPALSADGRHVAFWSGASNLVPGDTNQWGDVFLRHLAR